MRELTLRAHTHLRQLEAESIQIIREVAAEFRNPVMLYSADKDASVLLHLMRKAFYPGTPPFPLLHVNTTWAFREVIAFRDRTAAQVGMELIEHVNEEGRDAGVNPFDRASADYIDVMRTQALKQALDKYGFDAAFGAARRDEEASRAKERVYSFRDRHHRRDPSQQRPELWNLYNGKVKRGESIRVFPLASWTELDVWQYIHLESIPIVSLYYAEPRPVVIRDAKLLMVDDDRFPLAADEAPEERWVRFGTLSCYPLSGAIESRATTLPAIIQELLLSQTIERADRGIDHDIDHGIDHGIDHDGVGSASRKTREGYC